MLLYSSASQIPCRTICWFNFSSNYRLSSFLHHFTNRKIAAYVCTTIAGVHALFIAEYKLPDHHEDHVFTPINVWVYNQKKRFITATDNAASQSSEIENSKDNNTTAIITPTTTMISSETHGNTNNHNDNISELRRIAKGHNR